MHHIWYENVMLWSKMNVSDANEKIKIALRKLLIIGLMDGLLSFCLFTCGIVCIRFGEGGYRGPPYYTGSFIVGTMVSTISFCNWCHGELYIYLQLVPLWVLYLLVTDIMVHIIFTCNWYHGEYYIYLQLVPLWVLCLLVTDIMASFISTCNWYHCEYYIYL